MMRRVWSVLRSPARRWLLSPPALRDPTTLRAGLVGRTVLITGASQGIGEATARVVARAGADVLLLARNHDRLTAVADAVRREGGRAWVYPCDLANPEDVQRTVQRLNAAHPQLQFIVSNAGRSIRRPVALASQKRDLERSLAVNFSGPAALLLGLLPVLLAQDSAVIVNVSTVSARPPGAPRWGSYQGSKAGFDLWLRALGTELLDRHLSVRSVYLPLVRTPMSTASGLYDRMPALSAHEAAEVVAGALVTARTRFAPWWLRGQDWATLLWPDATDRLLNTVDRWLRRREGPTHSRGPRP